MTFLKHHPSIDGPRVSPLENVWRGLSSLHTAASCGINKAIKLIVTHSSPYAGPFSNCLTMFFYQLTAFLWEIVFTADLR